MANTTCRETSTTSTQYSFVTGYQGVSNDSPLIKHTTHSNKFLILFALMENSTLVKKKVFHIVCSQFVASLSCSMSSLTIGPGLSMYDLSKGCKIKEYKMLCKEITNNN